MRENKNKPDSQTIFALCALIVLLNILTVRTIRKKHKAQRNAIEMIQDSINIQQKTDK